MLTKNERHDAHEDVALAERLKALVYDTVMSPLRFVTTKLS